MEALLSNENCVFLGRSGTGKTLVTITKIFLLKMCSKLKETKSINPLYLRMVFCTTSDILVKEVKKYYCKMEKKLLELILESKALENDEVRKSRIALSLEKKELKDDTFDNLDVMINLTD